MFGTERAAVRWSVRAALTALAAGALVLPAVAVAQPQAAPVTPSTAAMAQTAQVQQEVRSGTLLQNHGLRRVGGLSDAQIVTTAKGSSTPLVTAAPAGNGPAQLAAAYSLPATSTSTNTIAIIDAGVDATLASDLATYRSTFGLPACTTASGCLKLENFNGAAQPAPQRTANGENERRADRGRDLAGHGHGVRGLLELPPAGDLRAVAAGFSDRRRPPPDFSQAVATAAAAGAKAVSISYGYSESTANTSGTDLADFNKPGVAITVSTGDAGFNGGTHQDWPSDLPSVIAVGGTTLTAPGAETAWADGGSGCETRFTGANGQPAAVTALCGSHRAAADVSADADPNTGLAVFDTDAPFSHEPLGFVVVGGTSASAPFIGGLFARGGVAATLNGPNTLYTSAATNFNDVRSGSNQASLRCSSFPALSPKICTAGVGYDGPTGLGTPHGLGAF